MTFRLGVDVGGTFTDLLLVDESSGQTYMAKVPSTPEDSSIGVLNGIDRICDESDIDTSEVTQVMHGTTVATNAVLTRKGAKVGLITTKGYRQVLQVARSFCPGGLGGWVSYMKAPLLAPLELTIEADERLDAEGQVITPLNVDALRADLKRLAETGEVEALTVCLLNSYVKVSTKFRSKRLPVNSLLTFQFRSVVKLCRRCRSTSEPRRRSSIPTCALRFQNM